MENELLLTHDHGMTRVVASSISDHHVNAVGQEIDILSLAFVAPLGPDDYNVRHRA